MSVSSAEFEAVTISEMDLAALVECCFDVTEAYKLARKYIRVTGSFPVTKIVTFVSELIKEGFTPDEARKVVRDPFTISGSKTRRIASAVKSIIALGFSLEEVRNMVVLVPSILGMPNRVCEVITGLEKYGLSNQEAREMAIGAPMILSYKLSRTCHGIDVLRFCGLNLSKHALKLICAPELLRARARYMFDNDCDESEMASYLAAANDVFAKKFEIAREELIALDPGKEAFIDFFTYQATLPK